MPIIYSDSKVCFMYRVEQCKENIKQLGELSDESDDLRAQAIMDCCQFDALLDIGIEQNMMITVQLI